MCSCGSEGKSHVQGAGLPASASQEDIHARTCLRLKKNNCTPPAILSAEDFNKYAKRI
jgi:hypothetical protein